MRKVTYFVGDALDVLSDLRDECVNSCITSPPYWALRDYGNQNQIGLENNPNDYIRKLVEVFGEVKRVLMNDGTLWINIGDTYVNYKGDLYLVNKSSSNLQKNTRVPPSHNIGTPQTSGLGVKSLAGIPFRLAIALQEDGWTFRQDVVWYKPNPMPERVTDRCTRAHEYLFMFSKRPRYYHDAQYMREVAKTGGVGTTRNRHSVWTVPIGGGNNGHPASFPDELVRPCILASCPPHGIVLDPFAGGGTTLRVAVQNQRDAIGIDINEGYVRNASEHITDVTGVVPAMLIKNKEA